jgi:hypothetical protein
MFTAICIECREEFVDTDELSATSAFLVHYNIEHEADDAHRA